MIVNQFNVERISPFKTEDNAPICPNGHRPHSFQIPSEIVQMKTRQVQCFGSCCRVEHSQYAFDFIDKIRTNAGAIAAFVKPLQATMLEAPDHLCAL